MEQNKESVNRTQLEIVNEKISEHSFKLFKKEFESGKRVLGNEMIFLEESNGLYNALSILHRCFSCDSYAFDVFIDKINILKELLELVSSDLSTAYFVLNERSLYLVEHLENMINYMESRRQAIIMSN